MLIKDIVEMIKNCFSCIIFLATIILFIACNKTFNPDELKFFVLDQDNGFLKTELVANTEYSVLYSHPQYEALKRIRDDQNVSEELVTNLIQESSEQLIFYIRLRDVDNKNLLKKDIEDNKFYDERLMYLLGDIKDDFSLLNGTDTISCSIHHFERGYGINPSLNITLAFNKPSKMNDFTFIYNDRLFGAGKLKFHYFSEEINKDFELIYF